jgi:hypothetical protein
VLAVVTKFAHDTDVTVAPECKRRVTGVELLL